MNCSTPLGSCSFFASSFFIIFSYPNGSRHSIISSVFRTCFLMVAIFQYFLPSTFHLVIFINLVTIVLPFSQLEVSGYYGFGWLLTVNLISTMLHTPFPHVCEPSRGKTIYFHSMSPPHLHSRFRIVFGLRFVLQSHPSGYAWYDSCSSGQRFTASFLQIPPRDGHPCFWLMVGDYKPP